MYTTTHIGDDKKDLVHDMHRLAYLGDHFLFRRWWCHCSKWFRIVFLSDVKAKKCIDLNLVGLKKVVLKKLLRFSLNMNMVFFNIKVIYMFQMLMCWGNKSYQKLTVLKILFTGTHLGDSLITCKLNIRSTKMYLDIWKVYW